MNLKKELETIQKQNEEMKAELEEILNKGMRNSHLLDKIKDTREKIQHFIDLCDSDTVAGANMRSAFCIALEEIDKLIESEN